MCVDQLIHTIVRHRWGAAYDLVAHPAVVQLACDTLGTRNVACWGAHYVCKLPDQPDVRAHAGRECRVCHLLLRFVSDTIGAVHEVRGVGGCAADQPDLLMPSSDVLFA